jgi:hypothetical protein
MEFEFTEFAEQKLRFIKEQRKMLLRLWKKEKDTFKRLLIQNRRKMLAEEFKQTTLNLGQSFN